jgi:hypothetical protein
MLKVGGQIGTLPFFLLFQSRSVSRLFHGKRFPACPDSKARLAIHFTADQDHPPSERINTSRRFL